MPAHHILVVALLASNLSPSLAFAQQASPKLVLEAAEVTPGTAAADALCQLRARIKNTGQAIASGFVFGVKLNEHEMGVYRNHVFMEPIQQGETHSLRLYGFWTSETGRPLPAAGDLVIELSLLEARWMKAEKDAGGTLVWSDLGAVEGLPLVTRQTLKLTR